jgi:WD40 repeat protein
MVVAFSNSGHLLATAGPAVTTTLPLQSTTNIHTSAQTSSGTNVYSLRVFDSDTGVEVWSAQTAHHGVVYSLSWSKDDVCLLTTSSDGTAKVWNLLALHPLIKKCVQKWEKEEKENAANANTDSLDKQTLTGAPAESQADGVGVRSSVQGTALREFRAALYGLLPCLYSVYAHAPPVYVYCGVFQELAQTSNQTSAFASTINASASMSAITSSQPPASTHPVLKYITQQLEGVDTGDKELDLPDIESLHTVSLPR